MTLLRRGASITVNALFQFNSEDTLEQSWTQVLSDIEREIPDSGTFTAFLADMRLLRIEATEAVIAVRNDFHADVIKEYHAPLLLRLVRKHVSSKISSLHFETLVSTDTEVEEESEDIVAKTKPVESPVSAVIINSEHFYEDYTFDNFVIGDSNQMAYQAALSVAEAPGSTAFNPLTIYGNTGLGKTHLLQAIGHFVSQEETASRVYYISALDFLKKYTDCVKEGIEKKHNTIHLFYQEFDAIDVLLIDDVQHLAGKEKTQKAFLAIFAKFISCGKQIVLSTDCLPEEIPNMHEGLVSHFTGGMLIDVQAPTQKTKIDILRQKAKTDNIQLSPDVLCYLAAQVTTNIRVLEGLFTKVLASSIFCNSEPSIETVQELVDDYKRDIRARITTELVQEKVASYFSLSVGQLRAQSRKRTVAYPRSIAIYLCRTLTKMSLKSIGINFGNRDYSTIIHTIKKMEQDLATDDTAQKDVALLSKLIQS